MHGGGRRGGRTRREPPRERLRPAAQEIVRRRGRQHAQLAASAARSGARGKRGEAAKGFGRLGSCLGVAACRREILTVREFGAPGSRPGRRVIHVVQLFFKR